MIIKIKRRFVDYFLAFSYLLFFLIVTIVSISFDSTDVIGANISNQSVVARVNVTGTEPYLYRVYFDTVTPIDLGASSVTIVTCNGSFFDLNGFEDVKNVTGIFYENKSGVFATDDANSHYTNFSCGNCTVIPNSGGNNGTCSCQFPVQYFANPGLWQCNMTINDSTGFISSANSTYAEVHEVLGISVRSQVLDYGNLSVSQVSPYVQQNITNGGNMPINISVRGFGGDVESVGTNLSMICEFGGNISNGYQRYSNTNQTAYDLMTNLTNQSRQLNLTLPQRTDDLSTDNSTNTSFWKLQVPFGVGGICNGTIIFKAIDTTP